MMSGGQPESRINLLYMFSLRYWRARENEREIAIPELYILFLSFYRY